MVVLNLLVACGVTSDGVSHALRRELRRVPPSQLDSVLATTRTAKRKKWSSLEIRDAEDFVAESRAAEGELAPCHVSAVAAPGRNPLALMTSTFTVQPVTQPAPVNPAVRTVTVNGTMYTLYDNLGSGGQATVVRGVSATNALVAVKVFFVHAANAASHELQFLQALQPHENVVTCLGAAQIAGPLPAAAAGIVMELAKGGDFMGYIMELKLHENPLDPAGARFFFLQMVAGLKHAHARGVVVCDLKPDNMLLLDESCRQLLLADFGHANGRAQVPARPGGTPAFEAPEVKKGEVTPNTADKIDVWSLGVCLFILVLGFNPFQNKSYVNYTLEVLKQAQAQGHSGVRAACVAWSQQARFDALPADLGALLEGMLKHDAARRLTLDEVVLRSGPWTAPPVAAAAAVAEAIAAIMLEASRTQLQPDRTPTYHEPAAPPPPAAAAGPTAAYRSMAAAQDDDAPMPRGLGALDASAAELPRYNACGAFYRSAADMEPAPPAVVAPPVLTIPMLERENARAA